jgi:hypothetical protein
VFAASLPLLTSIPVWGAEPATGDAAGTLFGITGVPGTADMVKVELPTRIAAGISWRSRSAARNSVVAIGVDTR